MKKLLILPFVLVLITVADTHAQIFNTSLTLTVRDDLGNTVEGATVQLFGTEADYLAEVNVVVEDVTDKKGVVKFKKLEPKPYYVIARKDDLDNSGGGEQIGKLEEGKFNKATVIIQ
ncbi:MAG TPA: carboxypeptidase-like regulatory domain-containing protein [Cyclobacteriaceae bacterium]|nr:carboxypeptidase regulatory-like domain-containing protein [Cyclobacteriaceae bacterium]MCB9238946.1 carboxypeptidase regulatory-like domain-containing protein [Flammeovirgaceae bacterium]MCB0498222.1 carboxypeptidase regulatory-like domain-containing protein [Cyclobacteriaceae bacterium]MCO5270664.1 carboxypeptidase-like regulatory domain-containing protein [Cyclobacteriaceae bacterium]MCW5900894.1 carboxypeptidase regulatory-like domain-containing protein [Cyclobacteriaceae bacterium]